MSTQFNVQQSVTLACDSLFGEAKYLIHLTEGMPMSGDDISKFIQVIISTKDCTKNICTAYKNV